MFGGRLVAAVYWLAVARELRGAGVLRGEPAVA
jgi:hypothetical protein